MISVDLHNMRQFIPLPYEAALTPRLRLAHDHLRAGTGAGGEFTGWVRLPEGYDREEFERIQAAAEDTGRFSGSGGHRHRRLLLRGPGCY